MTACSPEAISRIILTHGRIDHYGGIASVRARCNAPIAIHARDQQPLQDPAAHQRSMTAARESFGRWAGMDEAVIAELQAFDVLFTGDHLLATTNPRLPPARLEEGSGLDTYLQSLDAVAM